MFLPITALYGSLLVLIILWLSFKVGVARSKFNVSLGDGGHPELLEAIRRHGNAIEYVPMAVIMLALLEVNEANTIFLNVMGAILVVSRILHPMGLKADRMNELLRGAGAGGTILMMAVAACYLIWMALGDFMA